MNHTPVSSSFISSIGYDEESSKMEVKLKSGKTYSYEQVTPDQHAEIIGAPSTGKAYNDFLSTRQ